MEIVADLEEEEPDLPSYNEPGRLFFYYDPSADGVGEQYTIIDHDGNVFWLIEAGFPDYWLDANTELELEGHYVLEGITGYAWKDYWGEYDEEWTFEFCRRATEEEVMIGALS